MSLTIQSNINSLKANKELNKQEAALKKSFEKLSTGKEINKASDNPAALAIAMELLTDADTSTVAARNISDAVSVTNIVDSSLETASDITLRMRELATQASNGTYSNEQREALNDEFQSLSAELDRIAQTTEFNDQQLLSTDGSISLQIGTDGDVSSQISLPLKAVSSSSLGLGSTDISTQANATQALSSIESASETLTDARSDVNVVANQLSFTFESLQVSEQNKRDAASRILDADIATESANLVTNQIREKAALAVKAQANIMPELALKLLS
ncbi:MAG: flagellin FliC [Deltaproteobacteria bacterium]|nr:flagellin FliC [Deltaproteobacteria bacterium]